MSDTLANIILIGIGGMVVYSIYLAIINKKNEIKIKPASNTVIVVNKIIEHEDGTYALDLEYRVRGEYTPVQIYKTAETKEEIENIQAKKLNEIYKRQAQEREEDLQSWKKGILVVIIIILIAIFFPQWL